MFVKLAYRAGSEWELFSIETRRLGKINSCGNEHQEITWNCKQRDVCFRITPGLFHKKALRRSCATGSWDTKRETDHRCARCFLVPPDKSAGFVGSEAPLARHQTLRCSAPRMPGCPVCAAGDVTVELYGHTVTRENFIDEIEEQCCFRTDSKSRMSVLFRWATTFQADGG